MEIIKLDPADYDVAILKSIARRLAAGALVAFPTETVYGLGVNAELPTARERFLKLKGSPAGRPFTYHLAEVGEIYRYVKNPTPLVYRLIHKFWPGPLTLVLQDNLGEWVGLRVPDHPIARDIVRFSNVSVIASSANSVNQSPPVLAEEVVRNFPSGVDILIDSGAARYKQSSTVVRVHPDVPTDSVGNKSLEILREGVIKPEELEDAARRLILIVCTGNACRSPMTVGFLKKMLAPAGRYRIISGGTAAIYDSPATDNALAVMREFGINISDHRSQPVTLTMLEEADHIYVMTRGHLTTLKEWLPNAHKEIQLLDPKGKDIADPIGGDIETYRQCATKIRAALEERSKGL